MLGAASYPEDSGFPADLCAAILDMFKIESPVELYAKYRELFPITSEVMKAGQEDVANAMTKVSNTVDRISSMVELYAKERAEVMLNVVELYTELNEVSQRLVKAAAVALAGTTMAAQAPAADSTS
jgi:hypothetical protein